MSDAHPYRADAYLTEAEGRVLAVADGRVRLDRSVFYPAGGGQPGDTGAIAFAGGEARVIDAVKGPEDTVELVLAEGAPAPAPGESVRQTLDAARRRALMRVHTALHLLSVVVPLPVTGGAISEGKGRLDFDMESPPEDKAALETALQALIDADHPVTETWITDAELEANPGLVKTMSVKPPTGAGRVRLVRIGAEAAPVDLQPCGGTHVRATAEIGRVRLGKIEKKGRRNRRVTLIVED